MAEELIRSKTCRGFETAKMEDCGFYEISIQDSSSMGEPRIWLGLKDAPIQAIIPGQGWTDFNVKDLLPKEVPDGMYLIHNRMHINQEHAKVLIELLQRFVKTGSIAAPKRRKLRLSKKRHG